MALADGPERQAAEPALSRAGGGGGSGKAGRIQD